MRKIRSFKMVLYLTEIDHKVQGDTITKGVYVTIVYPAFCLLYLTSVHFLGELQKGGDVSQQKISVDQSELKK